MKELLAQQDIYAMPFPVEYGGLGSTKLAVVRAIEELSRCCATTGLLLAVQQLGAMPILLAGSEEQKRKYLPPLARGEWLAAFGLTEAGSGSDAAAMRTVAVRKGDRYILNGSKRFITNGGLAQVNTVFALTDPQAGTHGISAFIVERDFPGFAVGRIEDKMGIKGSQTAELIFNDCEVPVENLIGREGDGFRIAMRTLDRTRPGIGAQAVGIAQGALDLAVSYSKQRVQFGRPIAENQGIQFMLADMATKVEAARLLVYNVAEMIDRGEERFTMYSSMAKMFASDIAMQVTSDAIQILGGYGYMKEYPAERMLRDAKITQIYEGTNQIQRLVIARELLARASA
nr:acyl-CoA dehydrogenase family protein [Thermogemmatispora tikiterensis]